MAHYAFLNENNEVVEVIVGRNEHELGIDWEEHYSNFRGLMCKRTSYNGNYRKNFAGLGYTYNTLLDAFIPPKPYNSWQLNETTCLWQAPVAMPQDGKPYQWNEETLSWINIGE